MKELTLQFILSTSISLTTFFLGFFIRALFIKKKENKELKHNDAYIKWTLDSFYKAFPNQIEGYRILSINIKNQEYKNWNIAPELKPKILLEKQELIFKIIFNRKLGKEQKREVIFNRLFSILYLVDEILKASDDLFNQLTVEIGEYENLLDDIGTELYQYISILNLKKEQDSIEKKVIKIFNESTPRNRRDVYTKIMLQIENLILDENHSLVNNLLSITSRYNKNYVFYETILEQYANKVFEYQINLKNAFKDYEEILVLYKKLKDKSKWI